MSHFEKVVAKRPQGTGQPRARNRWRVGKARVTTEELEAWQLGPVLYPRAPRGDRSDSIWNMHELHV